MQAGFLFVFSYTNRINTFQSAKEVQSGGWKGGMVFKAGRFDVARFDADRFWHQIIIFTNIFLTQPVFHEHKVGGAF